MAAHVFSPGTLSFYARELEDAYRRAGNWPDDVADVEDDVFLEFSGPPPPGKMRGAAGDQPIWVDLPPPPTLTPQQQAERLMANQVPVAVQCTSIPALNGDYKIDAQTCSQITSIAAANAAGLGLPGGGADFNWPDAANAPHQWPATQFMELAKAIMNYIYAVSQVAQGHSNTFPALPIVIA